MEEILKHKKRINRRQKNLFLTSVEEKLNSYGYEYERVKLGSLIKSVNLETKCQKPDFVFIAHYDTGKIMPFWMNWLMILVGATRQLLLIAIIIVWIYLISPWLESNYEYISLAVSGVFVISFFSILFANKNNYDDNTSGVITLLKLAKEFKENRTENVKFVFVDNEELGLWGSLAHKKYMKKNGELSRDSKIISIDCVGGRGEIPLIIRNSKSTYAKTFQESIEEHFGICKSVRPVVPLSDNFSFRKHGSFNISFVSKSIIPGGYYIKDIHSGRDKAFNRHRIDKLSKTIVETVEKINRT